MLLQCFYCGSKVSLWLKLKTHTSNRPLSLCGGGRIQVRVQERAAFQQHADCAEHSNNPEDHPADPVSSGLPWKGNECVITWRVSPNMAQWLSDHALPFLLDVFCNPNPNPSSLNCHKEFVVVSKCAKFTTKCGLFKSVFHITVTLQHYPVLVVDNTNAITVFNFQLVQ